MVVLPSLWYGIRQMGKGWTRYPFRYGGEACEAGLHIPGFSVKFKRCRVFFLELLRPCSLGLSLEISFTRTMNLYSGPVDAAKKIHRSLCKSRRWSTAVTNVFTVQCVFRRFALDPGKILRLFPDAIPRLDAGLTGLSGWTSEPIEL